MLFWLFIVQGIATLFTAFCCIRLVLCYLEMARWWKANKKCSLAGRRGVVRHLRA